jgi:hypothetical protein
MSTFSLTALVLSSSTSDEEEEEEEEEDVDEDMRNTISAFYIYEFHSF